jgi:hypothetical protein
LNDLHVTFDRDRLTQRDFGGISNVVSEERASVASVTRIRRAGEASGDRDSSEEHLTA